MGGVESQLPHTKRHGDTVKQVYVLYQEWWTECNECLGEPVFIGAYTRFDDAEEDARHHATRFKMATGGELVASQNASSGRFRISHRGGMSSIVLLWVVVPVTVKGER